MDPSAPLDRPGAHDGAHHRSRGLCGHEALDARAGRPDIADASRLADLRRHQPDGDHRAVCDHRALCDHRAARTRPGRGVAVPRAAVRHAPGRCRGPRRGRSARRLPRAVGAGFDDADVLARAHPRRGDGRVTGRVPGRRCSRRASAAGRRGRRVLRRRRPLRGGRRQHGRGRRGLRLPGAAGRVRAGVGVAHRQLHRATGAPWSGVRSGTTPPGGDPAPLRGSRLRSRRRRSAPPPPKSPPPKSPPPPNQPPPSPPPDDVSGRRHRCGSRWGR